MVGPAPITCSISRWISRRRTIRCKRRRDDEAFDHDSAIQRGDIEMRAFWTNACQATDSASVIACRANTLSDGGDAVLVEQQEAQHHHPAGEQMGDVEAASACADLEALGHEQEEHGERRGGERAAEEDRIAEHPHLGDGRLADRQQATASTRSLARYATRPSASAPRLLSVVAMPNGTNRQASSEK